MMYNLFVSLDSDNYEGKTLELSRDRCINEYTSIAITEQYGTLNTETIKALKSFPCIFYKAPKFGVITDIQERLNSEVHIQYKIHEVEPFLTYKDLCKKDENLDIAVMEMHRTHWAVKQVDLVQELQVKNITLPTWVPSRSKTIININDHIFDVGLSFSGAERDFVKSIATVLENTMGSNKYFYDDNYTAQLGMPSLDNLL